MSHSRSNIYVKNVLQPTYDFTKLHFFKYIAEINIAHVAMLAEKNILSKEDAGKIILANQKLLAGDYTKEYNPVYEDLFFMIEEDLKNDLGDELVGNMHIAFSRNDMDATMFRMLWREKLVNWLEKIIRLKEILLELALEHELTVMPAYTHNQQAQPTTFAHYLLAVDKNLERDLDRGIALLGRINESPMGAAALGTTGFPIDRDYISKQLAFDRPLENSYDSIGAADYMLEIVSTLSTSLTTLSRFVYDLMFFATNEVDAITIDESLVQTSSIMPQKRNPSSLEHTRSSISRTIGELQSAFMMTHSVPFGDIVDIGDDIQPIIDNGFTHSDQILELLSEILSKLTVNKSKLVQRCREGFSTVTEIADVLVRDYHLSFRKSHTIVQKFVRTLSKGGKNLTNGNADIINQIAKESLGIELHLTDDDYTNAVDPYQFIMVRSIKGGPNPKETNRQRIQSLEKLKVVSEEIQQWKNRFTDYKELLRDNSKLFFNKK